eukprot:s327_g5.t2
MAKKSVTVVGSGNWGMAIATIIAGNTSRHPEFEDTLTVWMFEEEVQHKGVKRKLSEVFNETKENVKYLPGITLPEHVKAEPDLKKAVMYADVLIWVLPHQFVARTVSNMGKIKDTCVSVSLIKGGLELEGGKLGLCSDLLRKLLGHEVGVLMGANVANEVAAGEFCEATLGIKDKKHMQMLVKLFDCRTFRVTAVDDIPGVELCGALKNVVALGAGFCDGLDYGGNTKAALIRIGLQEMKTFIRYFYPEPGDRCPMATRSGSLGRARSEGAAKLPAVSRRVGSSPPERKAPSSQSTDRSSKLPSIAGPGVPSGYRSDMDARPKRTPPTAPRGKPPASRAPAVSSAVASAPAGAGDAMDLKNYVSDDLRKVLEEEEVSYNWRRRPKPPSPVEQAPPVPSASESSQGAGRQNHGEVKNSKSSSASRAAPAPVAPAAQPAVAARGSAGYALAVKEGSTAGGAASLQPSFCAKLEPSELTPNIHLVSYDGGVAMLMAGPLCSSSLTKTAPPPRWFLRWIQGRSSTKLFSLAADDWVRAELGSMESPGAPRDMLHGVPPKALLAGLLGDPSLKNSAAGAGLADAWYSGDGTGSSWHQQTPGDVGDDEQFDSPNKACCKALHEVMAATDPLETMELLTSQVEVALGRLEPPRGCGPAELLQAALRRELLRCLWCARSFEGPGDSFDDAWLLRQLPRSPEALLEEAATEEMLRRENEFLDRYLVRLMKLKRSLSFLLETWQKVDHYQILGVSSSASDKELRNAYRKACLRLHPDKGGDKQQFQQLQDSYARILEERQCHVAPERPPSMPGRPRAGGAADQGTSWQGQCEDGGDSGYGTGSGGETHGAEPKDRHRAVRMPWDGSGEAGGELSELAPSLSEASMEVAESSLALAARHAAVPCALLLTDVALSMTLEASRLQQTGKSLLDTWRLWENQ